jgi:hypothetical protein
MRPRFRSASTFTSFDRRRGWRSVGRGAAATGLLVGILLSMVFAAATASAGALPTAKRAACDSPKLDPIVPALHAPTARAATDDDIPGVALPASPFSDSVSSTTDLDDVFGIALAAGQTLTVALVGPSGSQFNIYLYAPGTVSVKNPDTPYVAVAAGTSYPCSFSYTATQSGTYYLDVYAKTGAGGYTVTYSAGGGEVGLILSADPGTVPYHGTVYLTGALMDVASGSLLPNREITWYAAQDDKITGSWIAQGTQTSTTGEYTTSFWLDRLTYFAVHFEGDAQYSEGWSNWVKVKARAKVTPPAVPSQVRAYALTKSWGTIKPAHTAAQNRASHTKVYAQHFLNGKWGRALAFFATSYRNVPFGNPAETQYSLSIRWAPGKWRVRAVHRDSDHVTTTSSWRTFRAN